MTKVIHTGKFSYIWHAKYSANSKIFILHPKENRVTSEMQPNNNRWNKTVSFTWSLANLMLQIHQSTHSDDTLLYGKLTLHQIINSFDTFPILQHINQFTQMAHYRYGKLTLHQIRKWNSLNTFPFLNMRSSQTVKGTNSETTAWTNWLKYLNW